MKRIIVLGALIVIAIGLALMEISTLVKKPSTVNADRHIRMTTDKGAALASFFEKLDARDPRFTGGRNAFDPDKAQSATEKLLSWLGSSRLARFLGLSPTSVLAQNECGGAFSKQISEPCAVGCGTPDPIVNAMGNSFCTGNEPDGISCTSESGCSGQPSFIVCPIPNCS